VNRTSALCGGASHTVNAMGLRQSTRLPGNRTPSLVDAIPVCFSPACGPSGSGHAVNAGVSARWSPAAGETAGQSTPAAPASRSKPRSAVGQINQPAAFTSRTTRAGPNDLLDWSLTSPRKQLPTMPDPRESGIMPFPSATLQGTELRCGRSDPASGGPYN
jgi:hypothetical protein